MDDLRRDVEVTPASPYRSDNRTVLDDSGGSVTRSSPEDCVWVGATTSRWALVAVGRTTTTAAVVEGL